MLLPTPRTTDSNGPGEHGEGGLDLRTAIHLLPTPTAADGNGGRRATNLEWKAGTAYRPSGAKASVSLQEAVDLLPTDATERPPDQFGRYTQATEQWEHLTRPAPHPTASNSKGNQSLNPRFVEWMMGLPEGHVTGHDLPRSAELRILGNGVVPQQAAQAIKLLTE